MGAPDEGGGRGAQVWPELAGERPCDVELVATQFIEIRSPQWPFIIIYLGDRLAFPSCHPTMSLRSATFGASCLPSPRLTPLLGSVSCVSNLWQTLHGYRAFTQSSQQRAS